MRCKAVWDNRTGWQRGGALAWQVFNENGKSTTTRGKAEGIPVVGGFNPRMLKKGRAAG